MYRVFIDNQTTTFPLYDPIDEDLRIFDPVLTQEMGQAGSFEFSLHAGHPHYNKINLLKSEIVVREDDEIIFRGRVLKPEKSMQNMVSIICEGELTYLIDSVQRPYEHTGSITAFIDKMLQAHNSQVDDHKKIYRGNVTITDPNDYIIRADSGYATTLEVLKTKLVDTNGGYLRIRHSGGKRYLDYLWDYGGINNQIIRFGENLLDITHYMDATDIVTCLIPTGADVEYTDEIGEKQTREINIASVNGGLDYIQNDAAIAVYGKVWGHQKWEDVTLPENLLKKAQKHLEEIAALPTTMEINAVDLSLIDASVQKYRLGYWTQVSSAPHGIEQKFMLIKREINLLDPTSGSITLGRETKTFTGNTTKKQAQISEAVEKVAESASAEINRKVENATNLITGGLGGYVVLDNIDPDTGKQMHPWRILIMNTPVKDTAKNVIQFNQNGIGFSTTGIDGPYSNAWTIDGNLVADFITAGTMLSDRIRGGILEVGGSALARNGKILIKDTSDKTLVTLDTNGIEIRSGVIDLNQGLFYADNDQVIMGGFKAYETPHGRYLATDNEENGIGEHDTFAFWTGWDGVQAESVAELRRHYGAVITKAGNAHLKIIYADEIYLSPSWHQGWSLTATLEDIYKRLNRLDNAIEGM